MLLPIKMTDHKNKTKVEKTKQTPELSIMHFSISGLLTLFSVALLEQGYFLVRPCTWTYLSLCVRAFAYNWRTISCVSDKWKCRFLTTLSRKEETQRSFTLKTKLSTSLSVCSCQVYPYFCKLSENANVNVDFKFIRINLNVLIHALNIQQHLLWAAISARKQSVSPHED